MPHNAQRLNGFVEERAELDRILQSKTFARAPSLTRLLAYLCNKYFAGEAAQIKEYTIAVELFGRSEDFYSREDPIVRVDANRLRTKIKEYYRTEGKGRPIQISIPQGQYAPVFQRQRNLPASTAESQDPFSSSGLPLPAVAPAGEEIRIMAGSSAGQYVDKGGKVWVGDRFFKGGDVFAASSTAILRADDSPLCRFAREGDFQYDFPLRPGIYELHLYFVEMLFGFEPEGGGETSRIFDVSVNGEPVLDKLDIISDANGSGRVDIRVITDVSPAADGCLHLSFSGYKGKALVNGIEILPGIPGCMRPVRIIARSASYISSDQRIWEPDRYFRGGRTIKRLRTVENTVDFELYQSERFGHFSYTIPAAPGRYTAVLKFAETYFGPGNSGGGGFGSRLFNIFCNGRTLLQNLDIAREAGGENRAVDKVFRGLEPNAQGKLILDFIPVVNYACVNAIEIIPE